MRVPIPPIPPISPIPPILPIPPIPPISLYPLKKRGATWRLYTAIYYQLIAIYYLLSTVSS